MYEAQAELNDRIWTLQEQLYEAQNEKQVVEIIDLLKEVNNEL